LRFSGPDLVDGAIGDTPQWLELPPSCSHSLRFSTWFKWEPKTGLPSGSACQSIWAIGDTGSDTHSTGIWIHPPSRSLYVYGVSTAAAIAVPGEWTHVAVTFDGKTAALYVLHSAHRHRQ
jgi:hypothetical protein